MSSIADINEMRKTLCAKKEEFWKVVNEIDEILHKYLDKENQVDEYQRVYNPSLRAMHQCVTNFAKQFNEKFDKTVARENAREAYLKRQNELKNEPAKGKVSTDNEEAIENLAIQENDGIGVSNSEQVNIGEDIDSLPDSEYIAKPPKSVSSKFRLHYKGITYQSGKKICAPGLDVPLGLFRCIRKSFKCDGKIETVENSDGNGRASIIERDAHTCE